MNDEEWITANAVAAQLGVTRSRVYQLVRNGQLPAPRVVDGRTRVWAATDVTALAARREGRTVSGLASALSPAAAPLPRVLDEVVDCEPAGPLLGARSVPIHLRIWDGPAPEGRRVVVVIGYLTGELYPTDEQASDDIARRWLPVPEMDAVWFRYRPDTHDAARGHLTNVVFEWPSTEQTSTAAQVRPWLVGRGRARGLPAAALRPRPRPRTATFANLDALVGAPVEGYPPAAYTADTVRRFRASGRTLEVAHDNIMLGQHLDAAVVLDTIAGQNSDDRVEAGRRTDAAAAATLLADDTRARLPLRAGLRGDGTGGGPHGHGAPDPAGPQSWAARTVPVQPTRTQQQLLDRYPDSFDLALAPDPARPAHEALLRRLWAWADDTDPYADHPDPTTHGALTTAADLLRFHLHVQQCRRTDDPAQRHPHRDTAPRAHTVRGPIDRAFLDGLTGLDPFADDETTTPGGELRRRARVLAATLSGYPYGALTPTELTYGRAPAGHLVAATATPDRWTGCLRYACDWPLRAPAEAVPDAAVLLADAGDDDRPVYIDWPDGRLTPLPGRPRNPHAEPWSFGPDSTPGALVDDIAEVFAGLDGRARQAMPTSWLHDELLNSRHATRLRVPVAELRGQY